MKDIRDALLELHKNLSQYENSSLYDQALEEHIEKITQEVVSSPETISQSDVGIRILFLCKRFQDIIKRKALIEQSNPADRNENMIELIAKVNSEAISFAKEIYEILLVEFHIDEEMKSHTSSTTIEAEENTPTTIAIEAETNFTLPEAIKSKSSFFTKKIHFSSLNLSSGIFIFLYIFFIPYIVGMVFFIFYMKADIVSFFEHIPFVLSWAVGYEFLSVIVLMYIIKEAITTTLLPTQITPAKH